MFRFEKACLFGVGLMGALTLNLCATESVPSEDETKAAFETVASLTKADYEAHQRNLLSGEELVAALLDRARATTNHVCAFILRREVFRLHVDTGRFEEASRFYETMRKTLGLVYAQALVRPRLAKIARFALLSKASDELKDFSDRLTATEELITHLKQARLKAEHAVLQDEETHLAFSDALARVGEWNEALAVRSELSNLTRHVARYELHYPRTGLTRITSFDVATYWWDYGEAHTNALSVFHDHARHWYRQAIENGAVPSDQKDVVLKRLEEVSP